VDAIEHRVAVVLDPDYAERIIDLSRKCHAWVVRSAANDAVVAGLRQDSPAYSSDEGVSSFNGAETPEAAFLTILSVVEEHHGAYSHHPPFSVIEVIGLEPSKAVSDELSACGFGQIEPSEDGFVARRDPPARPEQGEARSTGPPFRYGP
jgi:hypothetical protein